MKKYLMNLLEDVTEDSLVAVCCIILGFYGLIYGWLIPR